MQTTKPKLYVFNLKQQFKTNSILKTTKTNYI